MRKKTQLSIFLVSLLASTTLFAETWNASCNDGKNIHYQQHLNGVGFLFMAVEMPDGSTQNYQIARLLHSFSNDIAICGAVEMNGVTNTGTPITQICANQNRQIIYVKSKDADDASQPFVSGSYCSADVEITS